MVIFELKAKFSWVLQNIKRKFRLFFLFLISLPRDVIVVYDMKAVIHTLGGKFVTQSFKHVFELFL